MTAYSPSQEAMRHSVPEMERALRSAKPWSVVRGHAATCPNPTHEDRSPSGWVKGGDDGIVRFSCQSCGFHGDVFDIMAVSQGKSVGAVLSDARGADAGRVKSAPASTSRPLPDLDAVRRALPGRIVAEYRYERTPGDVAMIVCRCETDKGKTYRPAHPAAGGWILGAPPKPWPLYHPREIVEADTIVVVEGEKCADALAAFGIVATTTPFGAGKAAYADLSPLAGKNCILWPDHDEPGHAHMRDVASRLAQLKPASRISRIDPASLDLGEGEDVADLVTQFRTLGKTDAEIAAELRRVLDGARTAGPLDGYRQRQAAIARGEIRCVRWKWAELTTRTRALQPGRVTIVAGRKGSAKSFFLLENVRFWIAQGESVAVTILEGTIHEYLDRALAQLDDKADLTDLEWVRAHYEEAQAAVERHAEELARLQACVTRADVNITLEQLADWTERQAKAGTRIVSIDPISAAVRTGRPWVSDPAFLGRIRATAEGHGCSIVLVTHLQKGANEFTPDALAGSACYERFSDTIIQLHRHDDRKSLVKSGPGTSPVTHNTTLFIEKARAPGAGLKFAYHLDGKTLKLCELGLIVTAAKSRREDNNDVA
jgi:hypothetical protein